MIAKSAGMPAARAHITGGIRTGALLAAPDRGLLRAGRQP